MHTFYKVYILFMIYFLPAFKGELFLLPPKIPRGSSSTRVLYKIIIFFYFVHSVQYYRGWMFLYIPALAATLTKFVAIFCMGPATKIFHCHFNNI